MDNITLQTCSHCHFKPSFKQSRTQPWRVAIELTVDISRPYSLEIPVHINKSVIPLAMAGQVASSLFNSGRSNAAYE